ncbi:hypothetical protein VULLAG_LOCUS22967 [Vulpes lagopus]
MAWPGGGPGGSGWVAGPSRRPAPPPWVVSQRPEKGGEARAPGTLAPGPGVLWGTPQVPLERGRRRQHLQQAVCPPLGAPGILTAPTWPPGLTLCSAPHTGAQALQWVPACPALAWGPQGWSRRGEPQR